MRPTLSKGSKTSHIGKNSSPSEDDKVIAASLFPHKHQEPRYQAIKPEKETPMIPSSLGSGQRRTRSSSSTKVHIKMSINFLCLNREERVINGTCKKPRVEGVPKPII